MAAHRWLHAFGAPAARRLFCFHHAGGAAKAFYPLSKHFGEDLQVCGVQLPGRWGEGQLFRRLDELVPAMADGLAGDLVGEFAFLGHSLGTRLAFELMRELRRRGCVLPIHFFPMSATPPHAVRRRVILHQLSDEEFLEILATRFGGIPEALLKDRKLLGFFLPPMRADIELLETSSFAEEAPLPVATTALSGADDDVVTPDSISRWSELVSGPFDSHILPGGHFFLKDHEAQLAHIIRSALPR